MYLHVRPLHEHIVRCTLVADFTWVQVALLAQAHFSQPSAGVTEPMEQSQALPTQEADASGEMSIDEIHEATMLHPSHHPHLSTAAGAPKASGEER